MVVVKNCHACGTVNPRYKRICVSCGRLIANDKNIRICKEDLGKFEQIVISRGNKVTQFYCVFENFTIKSCDACPYHYMNYCRLLKEGMSICSIPVCQNTLDIQYVYIMSKLHKFMDGVPLVCCNCYDMLDRRNQRKYIIYEDDFYAHT